MLENYFTYLFNGLTMGAIYALLAIGVTTVYKSMGMLNVAHADTIMISAFVVLILFNATNSLIIAAIVGIIVMGVFGLSLERFIYRRLNYESFVNLMIATIGMQIIMRNSARAIWGVDPYRFPNIFSSKLICIGSIKILPQSIGIIAVSGLVVLLLQAFYKFTKTGQGMIAASTNPKAAMMLGIDVSKTRMLTFGISAMLACVCGILIAPMYHVSPDMGASVGLKGFAAAIIGGFGSVPAALIGGLLLGFIESLSSGLIASAYRDIISFSIMVLILYFKPAGLFAKRIEQKF
jgi:branched-chain amino acid transport system permease protein